MLERLQDLYKAVLVNALRGLFILGGALVAVATTLICVGLVKESELSPLAGAGAIPGALFSSLCLINGWRAENPLSGNGLFLPWLSWSFIIGGLLAMVSGLIYFFVHKQPWIECVAVIQLGLIVAYCGHRIRKRVLRSRAAKAALK